MMSLNDFIQSHKEELGLDKNEESVTTPKVVKSTKSSSTKVSNDELDTIFDTLKQHFSIDQKFSNADLASFLSEWNLTNRQTPSRLKKLAEQGLLVKYDTKPLTYSVKGE